MPAKSDTDPQRPTDPTGSSEVGAPPSAIAGESQPGNGAGIPAPAPQAAPAPAPPTRRGRGFRLLLVLLLIVVSALGYGAYWWVYLRGTLSTDDAYVDARIISVAARLSERVDSVPAREGDTVEAGAVLARFARDRLELRVREALADVRAAEAGLQEVRNAARPEEIQVLEAEVRVLEVALELQDQEWERAQALHRVKAISAQELQRRRSALATARSELEVSRRRLTLLRAGRRAEEIEQAEAALALARTRLGGARADLDESELRAPVTGTVARRMVDPGEVVQNGQALFQIVESSHTWVVANLEEDEITQVAEGQPVRIWVDAYPGREFTGRVGPVYAATLSRFSLLPSSSASGSFIKVTQRVPVRIDWESTDLPPMYPGLNVIVRIELTPRQ